MPFTRAGLWLARVSDILQGPQLQTLRAFVSSED
jgi:hypothetical protein